MRKYEIQADYLLTSLGMCYPPETQFRVNEKWVPVERVPPSEAVYTGEKPSSGQSGGKKKKKETKKKPQKARAKGTKGRG